jgi:hypothetical protein
MGLKFLFHERMNVAFFILENLLHLGALVVGEIESAHGESHAVAKFAAHAHAVVMHSLGAAFGDGECDANHQRDRQGAEYGNLCNFRFHVFLLMA